MDRLCFLRCLPYLYPIPSSISEPWTSDTGKEVFCEKNLQGENGQHQNEDSHKKHEPEIEPLFGDHVVSIEPGPASGPAFFRVGEEEISQKGENESDEESAEDNGEKKENDKDKSQKRIHPFSDDPALCLFRAALVPLSVVTKSFIGTEGDGKISSVPSGLFPLSPHKPVSSPFSSPNPPQRTKGRSSISRHVSNFPSSSLLSSPEKSQHYRRLFRSGSEEFEDGQDDPRFLVFLFDKVHVFAVDWAKIQSMEIEPQRAQGSPEREHHEKRGKGSPSSNSKEKTHPSSLLIRFESCTFRIFAPVDDADSPENSETTVENEHTTGENQFFGEAYLQAALSRLERAMLAARAHNGDPIKQNMLMLIAASFSDEKKSDEIEINSKEDDKRSMTKRRKDGMSKSWNAIADIFRMLAASGCHRQHIFTSHRRLSALLMASAAGLAETQSIPDLTVAEPNSPDKLIQTISEQLDSTIARVFPSSSRSKKRNGHGKGFRFNGKRKRGRTQASTQITSQGSSEDGSSGGLTVEELVRKQRRAILFKHSLALLPRR